MRDVNQWRSQWWGTGGPHLSGSALGGRCALREGDLCLRPPDRKIRSSAASPMLAFKLALYLEKCEFAPKLPLEKVGTYLYNGWMLWTIEQLRYFVAASEEGSISAAARRLGKAQSAVSTAISLLEADLGFELFDRSRRNARLTDQGEVMLLEAKELLRQAEGLNHRANALAYGEQPQLSLALDEALPYQAVSELMRDLAHQFAYLELTLLNGTSTEVAEYVEKQRADIGFHVDRGAISSALGHKYIGAAVQGVFVAGAHPLAGGAIGAPRP